MKKPFIEIDAEHFTLSSYEVNAPEGYEIPKNEETGEKFPYCCPFHKSVYTNTKEWFESFPNCCEPHKAMKTKWWFKKENYNGIETKVVNQLSYTEHNIQEKIENDDWYEDITDYIEYNISSFGHPAIGLDKYLGNVKHYVQNASIEIPDDKRKKLSEFIDNYYYSEQPSKTDLNILYATYQKWLKVFPFDVSFFKPLKSHFDKQLPLLTGEHHTNRYSGLTKAKMHTQGSLIGVLQSLTTKLLKEVNVPNLRKAGKITDVQANKLEFAEAELNTKTAEITEQFTKGELKYVKALKKWLGVHKDYFKEIAPLLEAAQPEQNKVEFEFDNNFDNVSTEDVYNHFYIELVQGKMISEEGLTMFLTLAFEKQEPPKKRIALKNFDSKDKVMKVFYLYYKNVAGKPHGKQKKYAALLGDYFQGFKTDTVSTNFSKSVY